MNNNSDEPPETHRPAKKFAIDVSWVFGSTIISLIAGIILRLLVGNYFGPKGLGLFAMVLVLTAVAGIFGDFGVPAALVKFISEHLENKKRVNRLISCSFINSLIIGISLTVFFYIFSGYIANLFNMPELSDMIKVVSFMFPFLIINDTFIGIFNGHRWMKKYTFLILVRRVGLIFITIFLILLGWGVIATIYALVIKEIAALITNIFMIRKFKIKFILKGHFKETKKLFKFSQYLVLAEGIFYFNTYLDTFFIGFFLTDEHVGIYAIATLIAHFFLAIPSSISRISYPTTSNLYAKKDYKRIKKVLNLCMRYSFIIISILGLLAIFFGKLILRIAFPGQPDFQLAYYPMIILIIGVTIRTVFFSIENIFSSANRPDIFLKIGGIGSIFNIILNALLIPIYGLIGGALATSVALSISSFLVFYYLKRMKNIRISINWIIIALPLYFIIIISFLFLQNFINPYLLTIIFFPLFIIFLYLGKIITPGDTQYLREILSKRKAS
jgi:stage V sporulation protein B